MAQQRKLTRREKIERAKQSNSSLQNQNKKRPAVNKLKISLGLIVAAFGFLLYIGTVSYSYTLDDYSTIKENYVVQQGVHGIGTILKTSYRYGYWSSNDELYRPLSLVMFAIEWSFFPDNPAVPHFINVLLYALTGFILFILLYRLFNNNYLISFTAAMLFMAHPVHTEVVASIKSSDEILSFLLSIVSLNWLLDYIQSKKVNKILLSSVAFFLALMAKESALTLLAVIPLMLFVFKDFRVSKAVSAVIPLFLATIVYIAIRASVLHGVIHTKAIDTLDNILVSAPDFLSRLATAIYVLGRYLLLLVLPEHLSIDYSLRQITILTFTDYRVLISLAIYLATAIYAVYKIRKKDVVAFGILYYLLTISIVSNIFIIIGTVMADRLLYLPSLGFCLIIAVLLANEFPARTYPFDTGGKAGEGSEKITSVMDFIKANSKPFIAVCAILALYSFKTIDRIPVWKNNYTLYSSGVEDAPNSSRTHYLIAIELKNVVVEQEHDSLKRVAIYKHAIDEFNKAIEIYPESFDSYRDMGRTYDDMGDTANAIKNYDMALKYNPHDVKAMNNKATIVFREKKYNEAMELFSEAIRWDPRYADALKNLGSCYGTMGDYENALTYFFKSVAFEKDNGKLSETYRMIGMTYQYMGNKEKADEYLTQSKEAAALKSNK